MSLEDVVPTRAQILQLVERASDRGVKRERVEQFLTNRGLHPDVIEKVMADLEAYEYGPSKRHTLKRPQ